MNKAELLYTFELMVSNLKLKGGLPIINKTRQPPILIALLLYKPQAGVHNPCVVLVLLVRGKRIEK
jgi:hypothetical protein